MPVRGGGNARGREKDALRGPGPTSLNPMRPDSENTGCHPRRTACQSGVVAMPEGGKGCSLSGVLGPQV